MVDESVKDDALEHWLREAQKARADNAARAMARPSSGTDSANEYGEPGR